LSYKGINVPTVNLADEAMTEKDMHDLVFGLKHAIDFVALSFVRTAADVRGLRAAIRRHLPAHRESPGVIVKIEKHEALANFDEILDEADGVMIARGDLGLETPVSRVPLQQKEIIRKCVAAAKPVITATEMLSSMERNPRPTRAEVSDVANAVIDHTDAVMLSGETAMGHYPVRAVAMMSEIIRETEGSTLDDMTFSSMALDEPVPQAMAHAAVMLADHVGARIILVTTQSGYSARAVTRFRPKAPIVAATENKAVYQQLLLSWGVRPLLIEGIGEPEKMVREAATQVKKLYRLKKGDKILSVSGLRRARGVYDSGIRVMEL
jgi:pyruvate kinase